MFAGESRAKAGSRMARKGSDAGPSRTTMTSDHMTVSVERACSKHASASNSRSDTSHQHYGIGREGGLVMQNRFPRVLFVILLVLTSCLAGAFVASADAQGLSVSTASKVLLTPTDSSGTRWTRLSSDGDAIVTGQVSPLLVPRQAEPVTANFRAACLCIDSKPRSDPARAPPISNS